MTFVLVVSILVGLAAAAPAAAESRDCLPLVGSGTQGAALLAGATMNVRVGGSPSAPLAVDVYPHADAATRPLALVLRGGAGTVGQRSSYVGQLERPSATPVTSSPPPTTAPAAATPPPKTSPQPYGS